MRSRGDGYSSFHSGTCSLLAYSARLVGVEPEHEPPVLAEAVVRQDLDPHAGVAKAWPAVRMLRARAATLTLNAKGDIPAVW